MVGYYYTKGDKELYQEIYDWLKDRVEYHHYAKRGHKWTIDGRVIHWSELHRMVCDHWETERNASIRDPLRRWTPRAKALNKIGGVVAFQAAMRFMVDLYLDDQSEEDDDNVPF